ncbi:tripartite tricarboxylate transporter TctB family protein [Acaricomes phytoseiuli]|uniref:tripartite tricarboxylate transporter TctB family protein n=1 Tax=Acaricomes phytoseiuli TaxID=291968 RepID=UPI0005B82233|nr:tripartite tricarboxylate transporter TctB family protein [Acaricomes phytoseiuli]
MSEPIHSVTASAQEALPTQSGSDRQPESRRLSSALVGPLVLAGFSTYLLVGILTMEVPSNASFPGPRVFPGVLMSAGYLISIMLALAIWRNPEGADPDSAAHRRSGEQGFLSDWRAVAWVVGGFLAFATGMPYLGWILAGALLFWCVTRAFRWPRPIFDLSIALVMSSLVYLAFGVGLGLNLPSGLLGGAF